MPATSLAHQPYRAPERVILYTLHQSRSQWVCHDVPRHRLQVFLSAQGPIVKRAFPQRTLALSYPIRRPCAPRLQSIHDVGQGLVSPELY